jgi:hypothetical protein
VIPLLQQRRADHAQLQQAVQGVAEAGTAQAAQRQQFGVGRLAGIALRADGFDGQALVLRRRFRIQQGLALRATGAAQRGEAVLGLGRA